MAKFAGGTSVDTKNYLKFTAGPLRGTRVHIFVAEIKLGRKLRPDETVHHSDLDKLNPHPDNLLILGKSEHGFVSNRQAWFLKNRERHELKWWQEWIETGDNRPTVLADGSLATEASEDVSFNPEALEENAHATCY
jgi:hypothetical protein